MPRSGCRRARRRSRRPCRRAPSRRGRGRRGRCAPGADPVLGRLALELVELGAVDLALGELGARLREVVGLGVAAYGVGDQSRRSPVIVHLRPLCTLRPRRSLPAMAVYDTLRRHRFALRRPRPSLQLLERRLAGEVFEAAGGVDSKSSSGETDSEMRSDRLLDLLERLDAGVAAVDDAERRASCRSVTDLRASQLSRPETKSRPMVSTGRSRSCGKDAGDAAEPGVDARSRP